MTLFDFFTSLLVWWYACGLIMLALKAQSDGIVTLCDVLTSFVMGGAAFLIIGAVCYLAVVHWEYTLSLLVILFGIGFMREKLAGKFPEFDTRTFCKVLWRKS